MTAVWMRARLELRSRWMSIVSLALIVGVIGGVVIAAAAGARRTETAYARFLESKNALDVVVNPRVKGDPEAANELLDKILALPQVKESSFITLVPGQLEIEGRKKPGQVFPILTSDGRFGTTINEVKILEGRMYDPNAADEIVPSFSVANELGLHVGQTLRFASGGLFGEAPDPDLSPLTIHVVGIAAAPGFFQPLAGGYLPAVLLSPAFFLEHHEWVDVNDVNAAVVLRHGAADIPSFRREAKAFLKDLPSDQKAGVQFPFNQAQQTEGAEQQTQAQGISLWVLAALVAIAGIAIFGQALARQTFLESIEYPTLRSLGMSSRQLVIVGLLRVTAIGLLGGMLAVLVAYLLSPFTPTGLARIAEPDPGFTFNAKIIVIGALGTVLIIGLLAAIPAWRVARAPGTSLGVARTRGSDRPSTVAGLVARSSFPPSAAAGVRMALEPGRGRTAVPVRTTILGATLGLVALTAALTFGASLDRLVTTPALSGWNWTTMVFTGPRTATQLELALESSPEVVGYAVGSVFDVQVQGKRTLTLALDSRKGSVTPSIVEGRLPQGSDEIMLGSETAREAGVGIGDTVSVRGEAGPFPMRVVGRLAVPPLFFSFARTGEGAAVSQSGRAKLEQDGFAGVYSIRLAEGVDQEAFFADLKKKIPRIFVLPRQESAQINNLGGVTNAPLALAGIVALMAAATMAHTLITSIRRRRGDLAILKTLGFVRRQVSATVAWQATTLASVAILIGIPLGVIAGRWGWNVFADNLGVVPAPAVPAIATLLIIPFTVLIANLVAAIPGRIASRLKAAPVLRAE